jgi:hypothetical protein
MREKPGRINLGLSDENYEVFWWELTCDSEAYSNPSEITPDEYQQSFDPRGRLT